MKNGTANQLTLTSTPRDGLTWTVASPDDIPRVRPLLAANGLPDTDVGEHIDHFVLAWDRHTLVATVGVELLGNDGLLRSLCVRSDFRGRGIAAALCKRVEAYARNVGVSRLYLLTTTAKEFFEHRGYSVCARDDLPTGVRDTAEFRSLCPSTAVCMTRRLDDGALYLPRGLLPLRPDVPGSRMWAVSLTQAMLTYFEVEPNCRFEAHSHDGEQITTVVEGELFFVLGEETIRVGAGEVIATSA